MTVIIGHAVGDERGKARGGQAGDQTGKEVRLQPWYKRDGGWGVYLEPKDAALGQEAANAMRAICENDNIGYDQDQRSTARAAALAAGSIEAAGLSETDCSAAVDLAYESVGLEVDRGSTHNLERRYMATGMFTAYRDAAHLERGDLAKAGGIYLTAGKHVCMVVVGNTYDPVISASEKVADDAQPTRYITPVMGTVSVRTSPNSGSPRIYIAAKGERLPLVRTDPVSKWHEVETKKGFGWITYKARYVAEV